MSQQATRKALVITIYMVLVVKDELWVGTFEHGLDILDINTGKVKNITPQVMVSIVYKTTSLYHCFKPGKVIFTWVLPGGFTNTTRRMTVLRAL